MKNKKVIFEGPSSEAHGVHAMGNVQGYLAHKNPAPLGPPQGPRHSPSVGSKGAAFSYGRGAPAKVHNKSENLHW